MYVCISYKIPSLLKGGNFPVAYPYPAKWCATRDLLRRRMYISRRCSELVAHIHNAHLAEDTKRSRPTLGGVDGF